MYDKILQSLEKFPDWFKAAALMASMCVLLIFLNSKNNAQAENMSRLREVVATNTARVSSLERDVESLTKKIDRIEGKIDILLTR